MTLHSGLLWLADGFVKHEKLSTPPAGFIDGINGSGDARCPANAGHKLVFRNEAKTDVPQVQIKRPTRSKVASRPHSAKIQNCTCSSHAHKQNFHMVPPADKAPRTGAWKANARKDYGDIKEQGRAVSNCYEDLPTHPDMRYFDRHSRCYNNPHCADNLMRNRPRTACAAGRLSLTQCECCGEVTSMMRYRYAPTGSAMTENMNSCNKTFLYPEKLLSYDSYKGRRRPSSAPSHSVSLIF